MDTVKIDISPLAESLLLHGVVVLGFVLGLLLVVQLLREPRTPSSTLAWLMVILFLPYVGVPFYLIFGGRKLRKRVAGKRLSEESPQEIDGLFKCRVDSSRVIADGVAAYETIQQMLAGATRSIRIATFILKDDVTGRAILDVLTEKAHQGVRVQLLLDAMGCFRLSAARLRPLREAGGEVAFFMPMLHLPWSGRANLRNHRKVLLVDGQRAVIGGMNIAEEYMGPGPRADRWRDLAQALEGPVVGALEAIFAADWAFARDETPSIEWQSCVSPANALLIASGPDVPGDTLYDHYIQKVFQVRERIWFATPYFVPDEMVTRALGIAARRGCDVRLVMPARSDHPLADWARATWLNELVAYGVKVLLYEPGMLHAKAALFDSEECALGSANLDMRSLFLNFELALVQNVPQAVVETERWFVGLFPDCRPFRPQSGVLRETVQGLARLLSPLL
ncbi:MAG: phospholipase D-like domain-containing protein [Gammaproteobacteria bacterium]